MDLKKFHGDGSGEQGRYNFDGTKKRDKSPTFATVDVRGQYSISKNVSLYLGVDNLFNARDKNISYDASSATLTRGTEFIANLSVNIAELIGK